MYGYDHIECKLLDNAQITVGGRNELQVKEQILKNTLVENGFCEIITYSFISPKDYENFGIDCEKTGLIKLFNPLGEDVSVMRTTLLPSMVNAIEKNINRKNLEGRLFELAKVYIPKSLPLTELPDEKLSLSLGAFGNEEDFFTLKGVIEDLLESVKYSQKISYIECDLPFMHPQRSANILDEKGEKIGYFGELHPKTLEKLGIDKRVYVAEIDYAYISNSFDKVLSFKNYSKYPSIERDLALCCDESVKNAEVIEIINSANIKTLVNIELFDVYTGDRIEKGKKSLAYRLTFSSVERTLGMEEVDGFVKKILKRLSEKDIVLR